jgi:pimeloyl-ACP methyl ester carboxylesterase
MERHTVGEGPARALLLPGNDLPADFYAPLAGALAARGLTTAVARLPGFAGEPPLPAPSWEALCDEVLAGAPPILLGHSMGGMLALRAAARRPEALRHLVLLEPAILPWRWLARAAGRRYLSAVVHGPRDGFVNWNGLARRVAEPDRYPPAAIARYLAARRAGDRPTGEALFATLGDLYPLPRPPIPTLLVSGGAAGWRARLVAARLAARLRPTAWVEVPGAAHFLVNEADDAIASHVARFVRGP